MKSVGFDQPLYILPFDHRGSFQTKMFGWTGALTAEQTAQIAAAKQVIYDGFQAAIAGGVPRAKAGILVDEQFGAAVLRDAVKNGYFTASSAEKSGQEEFGFEYGDDFAAHIEAFHPTFCKVLVRYNPEGDAALNRRQADRLKQLSGYLHDKSASRLMFELLAPEKSGLKDVGGERKADCHEFRFGLMVLAIHELQDSGVEPDLWKIEGLDARTDCGKVVEAARRGGRDKVSCIVLGRGEDDQKVREWLATAAAVPGFIGFAVGRTVSGIPRGMAGGKEHAEAAVAEVARRYREFVDVFEKVAPREAVGIAASQTSVLKRGVTYAARNDGLGRMGANMVRRLIKGGHQCVVFDMSQKTVQELVQEKAVGSSSLADFVKSSTSRARCGSWCRRRWWTRPSPISSPRWRRVTSSSTAATRTTSTTSAAPRSSGPRASIMSTWERAAGYGDSSAATA
jgi:5-dehydro-2-deoxygluconokinase